MTRRAFHRITCQPELRSALPWRSYKFAIEWTSITSAHNFVMWLFWGGTKWCGGNCLITASRSRSEPWCKALLSSSPCIRQLYACLESVKAVLNVGSTWDRNQTGRLPRKRSCRCQPMTMEEKVRLLEGGAHRITKA
jgi:hypothetical protein